MLGPEHPDTLTTRAHRAWWTAEAGDPVAARNQLTDLLATLEKVLGPEHPDTLTARTNLDHWTEEKRAPSP
ncbi:tetratricopeptide repeat protein [Streptomyces sp. MB09-01]|nr:tetratricopeptide repeat protein [Streptomyces sp. MB09-01]